MLTKCIIVENDVSQWSDQTGVLYHFPKRYKDFLSPGTRVIYYKGQLKNKKYLNNRLSEKPHYFAIALIGSVFNDKSSAKGDLFATIEDFQVFTRPVLAKRDGYYLEEIPENRQTNYWRDGVRLISDTVYERIISSTNEIKPALIEQERINNDLDASLVSGKDGKSVQRYVTTYERRPEFRKAAIAIHGLNCKVCNFNFRDFYGEYADGYIHIHHLNPVSQQSGPSEINPQTDLMPVCANCHSIIHRKKDKTLSINELKEMIKEQQCVLDD